MLVDKVRCAILQQRSTIVISMGPLMNAAGAGISDLTWAHDDGHPCIRELSDLRARIMRACTADADAGWVGDELNCAHRGRVSPRAAAARVSCSRSS